MKLKTDPSYTTLKYYYQDNTSSDTFLFKKDYKNAMLLGSVILTEESCDILVRDAISFCLQ